MDYRKLITELETKKANKEKEISKIQNMINKTSKDRATLYSLKLDVLKINAEIDKLKRAEVLAKELAEAAERAKEREKERAAERAKALAEAAERAKKREKERAEVLAKKRAEVLAKAAKAAEEADAAAKERAKAAEEADAAAKGRQLAEKQIFRGVQPKIKVEVNKEEEVKIEDKRSKQIELYKTNFKPNSNLITKTNLNVKSEEIDRITVELLQLDKVNKHSLYFFCNSLYLYGLKNYFDTYYRLNETQKMSSSITSVNWILRNNSMNCLHKVFTYKYGISSDTEKKYGKFLKVVPYNSTAFSKNDLSLFDIVNGYIFNLILDETNSELNSIKKAQYKKHVSKFDCSLLSYFKEVSKNKYKWDYDELYYIEGSDVKSPYKPDAENKLPIIYEVPDDPRILYKRCILVITSAIRHYDLFKIIVDYKNNKDNTIEIVQAILESKFLKFFEFMLFMGIKYGFHHHDLHQGNIIYDLDNSELVLIDYGRASFKFYCYNENTTLNSFLVNEIKKLNLLKTTYYGDKFDDINSYKKLIDKIKVLNEPMSDYILTIDMTDKKSTSSGQMIYPMIVFDLCTLILSIYNLLFEFLKKKIEQILFNY